MNDKLKIIAEYDGWKNVGVELMSSIYLTSLDALHPVAMKVMAALHKDWSFNAEKLTATISYACTKPPINGEYIALFNATVEGIIYLKNHSK
jgi:hypothetical protein